MHYQWRTIIDEILAVERYTLEQIAEELQLAPGTILRLYKGITKQPHYRVTSKLLALHYHLSVGSMVER